MLFRSLICAMFALAAHAGPAVAQGPTPASPSDAYFEFLLGRHLESEGHVDAAIAAHERAARLDPDAPEVPAELASLYARQGRVKEAMSSAQAALALDPANIDAHRVLGSVYASFSDGDAREVSVSPEEAAKLAIEHLEAGRREDGTDADPGVDLALARLYLTNGQAEQGAAVLRRLVAEAPEVLEARVLLARAELALGRPDQAIAALEEAAEGSPRLLSALADLYERQQRWSDAARAYERLSLVSPGSSDVRMRWASALMQSDTPESLQHARQLLEGVLAAAPADTRALYLLSNVQRRTRDFAAAEATARRLMELAPDAPNGSLALAQIYEEQRLFARAADVLEPVVASMSGNGSDPPRELLTLVAHLGYAQLQAGRADKAIATFEQARRLSGDNGSFDTSVIQAHLLARRYDRAAELARAARARRPDDVRFAQLEARALAGAGRRDRAVVLMREAAASHPDDVQAQLTLAEMLQEADRTAEADQVLDDAARKFPDDVTVPFQRGALLEQREDYEGAEAAFRVALARDPLHAPTLNYLGYMLADRGQRLDEAVSLVERALKIDPDNGSYLDSLAWAHFKRKQFERAEPLLQRAAEQLPGNSVVQDHLGDVLAAMGRRSDAIAAWKRALAGDRESVDVKAIEAKIRGR